MDEDLEDGELGANDEVIEQRRDVDFAPQLLRRQRPHEQRVIAASREQAVVGDGQG